MSIKGSLILIFIGAILGVLFANTHSIFLLIPLVAILFLAFKKYTYKMTLIVLVVFVFFNIYRLNKVPVINDDYFENEVEVIESKPSYLIVKDLESKIKYLVYIDSENETYETKDQLFLQGNIIKLEKDLELDVFDFSEYLKKKRIYYQIEPLKIEVLKTNQSPSNNIINFLTSKLESESYSMTKMLLFNDKYVDIETYDNLKEINALHLFVVSGFHISFFFALIMKIFKRKPQIGQIVAFVILTFYVFLLDFSISATRALLTLVLATYLSEYLNRLDCIAITGLLFLFIEPLNVYNYSFIMTYIMVITMAFASNALKDFNKIVQIVMLSIICFLAMIPIQLLLNYKINFISLVSNMFLSYIVIVIFILCILGLPLSLINGHLFSPIYLLFNNLILKLSNLNTSVTFGSLSTFLLVIYYVIFLIFLYLLENKKLNQSLIASGFIIIFFIFLYNRNYFLFYQQVTFLNVYQGDCAIIQDSFTNKVMLIDTGGLQNYDIASKKIMPYLNYHGIRKIDLVVISHNDYDHCGALESLKELIEIKQIINDPSVENISLGKLNFTNLNKYYTKNSSENDHSLVLYGKICNYNFLFTGDISSSIEQKIIKDNPNLDVDVLKVAHHGSKSSSCDLFISSISPEYAIISVGENNFYGHPTKEVLEILQNYNVIIYRTDENGSTRFKGEIFNKTFIESAK